MIDKINVMIKKFGNDENVEKVEAREAIEEGRDSFKYSDI